MKIWYDKPPVIQDYPYVKNRCVLYQDWYFCIDGRKIWMPSGYFFDGASIPRFAWSIIGTPFSPEFQAPAAAHDWIYYTHMLSRSIADEAIFQLAVQRGNPMWKCRTIWAAVRTGGALCWKNSNSDLIELRNLATDLLTRPDHAKFGISAWAVQTVV